jgi:Hypothetical glycosyl hydrolase family 15
VAGLGGYSLLRNSSASSGSILGDVDGNGTVTVTDLSILLKNYSKPAVLAQGDLDGSGTVDIRDLSILLRYFGKTEPATTTDPEGAVKFVLRNTPETDAFVGDGKATTQAWINQHYWRMEVFASYFWNKTSWYKNGWHYKDATSSGGVWTVINQHPDWILRDSGGNNLYIPWGCGDGICDSYAVDVGNPALRQEWIRQAKAEIGTQGYKGLWIDDVNMDWRVSDRYGNNILPIDPRTGTTMTIDAWRRYVAEFMEEIRVQMPGIEILHNSIWYAGTFDGSRQGVNDQYIQRQIKAADYINREAGFNDGGLTNGDGTFSYNALMNFVDTVHGLGRHVVIDSFTNGVAAREYGVASYLLVNNGGDGYGNSDASYPSNWWSGYDTNLGHATGKRYLWNGLWRRDFASGTVLTNPPGSPTRSVDLGVTYLNTSGQTVRNITIGASQGLILRKP